MTVMEHLSQDTQEHIFQTKKRHDTDGSSCRVRATVSCLLSTLCSYSGGETFHTVRIKRFSACFLIRGLKGLILKE